ncbi:hypothetical protein MKW92_046328 [Papaver armeniacum]|nr:hypothetical protein MKW92_046328 [Papaver armeniacum]
MAELKLSESRDLTRIERIETSRCTEGMVGQAPAVSGGSHSSMIKEGKIVVESVLLAGQPEQVKLQSLWVWLNLRGQETLFAMMVRSIDRPAVFFGAASKTGKMTLKTTDMETKFGKITKLWRSFARSRDYDAMGPQTKFVRCPRKGKNDMAPILVVATNRGITNIRGTNYKSPHGIPIDLLDHPRHWSQEEDVEMSDDAKVLLTKIGVEASLSLRLRADSKMVDYREVGMVALSHEN